MLLGTLVVPRKALRDLDAIVPKLRELGARHVAYGAPSAHYPVVGEALIASIWPTWRATRGGRSTRAPGLPPSRSSPAR